MAVDVAVQFEQDFVPLRQVAALFQLDQQVPRRPALLAMVGGDAGIEPVAIGLFVVAAVLFYHLAEMRLFERPRGIVEIRRLGKAERAQQKPGKTDAAPPSIHRREYVATTLGA